MIPLSNGEHLFIHTKSKYENKDEKNTQTANVFNWESCKFWLSELEK